MMMIAQVWQLSAREHMLLIVQHHSITDGISLGILAHELAAAYSAALQCVPPELPPLSVAYIDYAAWQREQSSGNALEAELSWWRHALADAPGLLELPTDCPRPSSMTFAGAHHSFSAPAAVRQGLQQLAKSRQTTEFVVVLAALQVCCVCWRLKCGSIVAQLKSMSGSYCLCHLHANAISHCCRCSCTSILHRRTSS